MFGSSRETLTIVDHRRSSLVLLHATMLTIKDAKEVFVEGMRRSQLISSAALTVQEGETFLKLEPGRFFTISKVILSRCTTSIQNRVTKNPQHFWKDKDSVGRHFLDAIRTLRKAAITQKYGVIGARFMSRRKKHRAAQLVIEKTSIQLPAVGDRAPVTACVLFDVERQRKNGRQALWIEMKSDVLEHISHMAKATFEDDSDHGGSDQEDIHGDCDEDYDYRIEACSGSSEHGDEIVGEHKDADVIEHGVVNVSQGKDKPTDQRARTSFPIFDAFRRGSTSK